MSTRRKYSPVLPLFVFFAGIFACTGLCSDTPLPFQAMAGIRGLIEKKEYEKACRFSVELVKSYPKEKDAYLLCIRAFFLRKGLTESDYFQILRLAAMARKNGIHDPEILEAEAEIFLALGRWSSCFATLSELEEVYEKS